MVLRVGVSSCRSSPCAHRALISFSTCFPYRLLVRPVRFPPCNAGRGHRRQSCYARVTTCRKVGSHRRDGERPRGTQCPRKRPAPPRQFQAFQTRVQVSTPAWQSRLGIREDIVPAGHQAKQPGLRRPLPAADARAHEDAPRAHLLQLLRTRGHSKRSLPSARGCRFSRPGGLGGVGPDIDAPAGEPGR
jgi:hypothetical protein